MDYSKLIHEYLDGELNTPLEDALFAGLSTNTELRTEFSQQIKLHIVAQNDMGAISPPTESTNKIFSSLGFSIPTGDYLNRIAHSSDAKKKIGPIALIFKKHLATIATAIISIALTSFVYTVFLNDKSDNGNIVQNANISRIPVTQSFSSDYYYNPEYTGTALQKESQNDGLKSSKYSSSDANRNSNYSNRNSRQISIGSGEPTNPSTEQGFKVDDGKPANVIKDLALSGFSSNISKNVFINESSNVMPEEQNIINSRYKNFGNNLIKSESYAFLMPNVVGNSLGSQDNTKYSVQVRGLHYANSTNELKPANSSFLDNVTISAFYKFNSEHSLGLEFGQEQFTQKFVSANNGQAFEYEQNPLFFWYGMSYRWTANALNIADLIYPFTQVFAGLANDAVSGKVVGPLGRAQVGLQLKPINNVTFSFGIEGTLLLYSVHNQVLSTDKLGLTYGISLSY